MLLFLNVEEGLETYSTTLQKSIERGGTCFSNEMWRLGVSTLRLARAGHL